MLVLTQLNICALYASTFMVPYSHKMLFFCAFCIKCKGAVPPSLFKVRFHPNPLPT